jgi:hypothetical protein
VGAEAEAAAEGGAEEPEAAVQAAEAQAAEAAEPGAAAPEAAAQARAVAAQEAVDLEAVAAQGSIAPTSSKKTSRPASRARCGTRNTTDACSGAAAYCPTGK